MIANKIKKSIMSNIEHRAEEYIVITEGGIELGIEEALIGNEIMDSLKYKDLNIIRQWYQSVIDSKSGLIDYESFKVFKKIMNTLGMHISKSDTINEEEKI
jgi:uncharacterized protein (UPF0371 family)